MPHPRGIPSLLQVHSKVDQVDHDLGMTLGLALVLTVLLAAGAASGFPGESGSS